MIVDLRTHVQMDSEINRSSSITNPQAAVHPHPQPFGDSREHMGSILYPRVRPVRHRVHRTPPPLQDAASPHIDPAPTSDETRDNARRPQPDALQTSPSADEPPGVNDTR